MTIRNFSYWFVRGMLVAFCLIAIYTETSLLSFIAACFTTPPTTPHTTTIDVSTAIWGAILILFLIVTAIAVIIFFSCQMTKIIRDTTMDILDEIFKGYGFKSPASWIFKDIIKRGDFSKCWNALQRQLH